MIADTRPRGGALLPDASRTAPQGTRNPYIAAPPERGTADIGVGGTPDAIAMWIDRQRRWYNGFQAIIPRIKRYWALYRAFDDSPSPGPGQEWRDRTVIPECFKIVSTRVPRLVLGRWGVGEPFTIQGRGFKDAEYEESIRELMSITLDSIGLGDPEAESFMKRVIDGTFYREIMGHVWWTVFWRTQKSWLKTKIKNPDSGKWDPVELLETIYDNVDINWLPLSNLAIDLYGRPRRWAIERRTTTLEALEEENWTFQSEHKRPLYPGLDILKLDNLVSANRSDKMDEPRDTEHWPLSDSPDSWEGGERRVELWYCWDNSRRTLTLIANRRVILDHGLAPTPRGLAPFISSPAIPLPGVPYGDSILAWVGPLAVRQTRLARARMDETLLNLFQQYLFRENALPSTHWFWRPGGMAPVTGAAADRPISDSIYLVPRRPLPPEGYQEEQYAQQQAEATAAADATVQGIEATNKSRDVTAAEIQQRALQGSNRYQLELKYHDETTWRPMLAAVFDLLKQNKPVAQITRETDDIGSGQPVDLNLLERPIDIIVGSPISEPTQAEKMQEIERLTNLLKDPNFALIAKHRGIFEDFVKSCRTLKRKAPNYVKSEQEIAQAQMQQMAAQMGAGMGGGMAGPAGAPPQEAPPGAEGAGGPGAAGLAGPAGIGPESLGPAPGSPAEEYL